MNKESIQKLGQKKRLQKIGAGIIAIALVVTLVIGLIPSGVNKVMAATGADLDTTTKYLESLGDEISTEFAGRIWTDKSVWDTDSVTIEAYGGAEHTITKNVDRTDEDFLVGFSALATSQSVTGQTQAPIDVVFVIDISGSMSNQNSGMDNGYSRIYNTVQALNTAIDDLMNMNEYTRVGVAAFSGSAQTLLPLDRYTKSGNNAYFSLNRSQASNNYADLTVNAVSSNGRISTTVDVEGGTNTQKGIYQGLSILADADSTTATINGNTIQRVPSLVLLSDGASTFSANTRNWWSIPANSQTQGPGSSDYYGNGMLAMMTGAYMKAEVDRHYGVTDTEYATTIYTIGMGIDDLTYNGERNLANITLNPSAHWNDNNNHADNIRDAWDHYVNGVSTGGWRPQTTYTPEVEVNNDDTYTINHPGTNDINGDPDALKNYVDQYYSANDADGIASVFADIVNAIAISRPEIPTEHDTNDPLNTGYITYTDPIGAYMEVKDLKSVIYAGENYTVKAKTTSGSDSDYTDTYVFEGTAGNEVYGTHTMDELIIEVHTTVAEDDIKTQTVTVKVPAAMIPIRVNTVKLDSEGHVEEHTNNGTYPIRVLYTVGLQDAVKADGYVNAEKLSAEYLQANINTDGSIDFYSNLFTGKTVNGATVGDATAEFEAAHTNPFYYMQKNAIIYTDEACTVPASTDTELQDDVTYYYTEIYYHGVAVESTAVARTGAQLKNVGVIDVDGAWARPAGSVRLNRMLEFEGTKINNSTQTAEKFYEPTFENTGETAYDGKFVVYLGNNGVMSAVAGGNLDITKTVTAEEGLTAPDKEFTFTVNLTSASNTALTGTYTYELFDVTDAPVVDSEGNAVTGTITNGGTITLKAGQTARILNLPPNAKYTVTEAAVAGFTTTVDGTAADTAAGTIEAGQTVEKVFNNHYAVAPITYPTDGNLSGTKKLVGRPADETKDTYTFLLTAYNDAPLPAGYDVDNGVQVTLTDSEGTFDLGTLKFTKPGVYRYTVVEKEPNSADYLPGMTYSNALYRMMIVVTDNGDGTLSATSEVQKLHDDAGNTLFTYEEGTGNLVMNAGEEAEDAIVFTNTYAADAVTRAAIATKVYTDNSGVKPLRLGMFQFEMEALGVVETDGAVNTNPGVTIPMPAGAVDGKITTVNEGSEVIFEPVTFTHADIPTGQSSVTYRYKITEVMPAEATAENNYTVNGMKYDPTVRYADVTIYLDAGSSELLVSAKYMNESLTEEAASFENSYTPAPAVVALTGNKTLNGRDMQEGESFEFKWGIRDNDVFATENTVIAAGDTQTKTVSGGTDGVAANFTFDEIQLTKPGTYLFYVTETIGNKGGVTYDEVQKNVTVVVTDNNGTLEAVVTYDNGTVSAATDTAVFVNTYESIFTGTPVSVSGVKNLTGRPLTSGQFYFSVLAQDGVGRALVSTTEDTADADEDGIYEGDILFLDNVTYDQAGTYEYIIREQIPTGADLVNGNYVLDGVTYDDTIYKVTVTVVDDGEGNLTASYVIHEVEEDPAGSGIYTEVNVVTSIEFDNAYNTTPVSPVIYPAYKVLSGNRTEALQAGEFEFEVSVEGDKTGYTFGTYTEGMTLDNGPKTITNNADGSITGLPITFIKTGTYTIQMMEVIPAGLTPDADGNYVQDGITYDMHILRSTFRVTDDGKGNLVATRISTDGATTFTNHYDTAGTLAGIEVTKNFTGRDGDVWRENVDIFNFELTPYGTATTEEYGVTITIPEGEDKAQITWADTVKKATFGDITFTKPGDYQFMIREVKPAAGDTPGAIPGVEYDATPRIVTVSVVDNGDGTMSASVTSIQTTDGADTDLEFVNVFDRNSDPLNGHNNLHVAKVLEGREWLTTDAFTFTLEAYNDDAKDPEKVEFEGDTVITATTENKEYVHFGNILFKHEGTYQFVVTEEIPTEAELVDGEYVLDGITYDTTARLITVVAQEEVDATNPDPDVSPVTLKARVAKVETGTLSGGVFTSTDVVADNSLTFTNTYEAEDVTLSGETNLKVTKNLVGRAWDILGETDSFTFTLEAYDEHAKDTALVTMPEKVEVTITKEDTDYSEAFGDIIFKEAGEYEFLIQEVIPAKEDKAANMIYDGHTEIVVVTVEDDQKGSLVIANIVYEYNNGLIWTNEYTPNPATASLEAKKSITGRQWLEADSFTFMIRAAAGTPMPDTVYAVANKAYTATENNVIFGEITYTAEGTYTYYIHELGSYAGITTDKRTLTAVVTVVNNQETGNYEVTSITYQMADETPSEEIREFVNEYNTIGELEGSTNLRVAKNFTGRPDNAWLDTDSFTFTLEADANHAETAQALADGYITMPEQTLVVTSGNKAAAAFGNIVFTKAGDYQFVVRETVGTIAGVTYDTSVKTVKVSATDNGDGTLTVVLADGSDALTFTNTYDADGFLDGQTYLNITKNFTGRDWRDSDQFTFALEPIDDATINGINQGIITLPLTDAVTQQLISDGKIVMEANSVGITISGSELTDKTNPITTKAFGDIHFTEAGVYQFRIREVKPVAVEAGQPLNVILGVIYDETPRIVTVTVTDNGDATLSATAQVTSGEDLTFDNIYDPEVEPLNGHNNLHVNKVFTGRPSDEWLDKDSFTFTLAADPSHTETMSALAANKITMPIDTTLVVTKTNKAVAHFGNIYFKQQGDYQFIVQEEIPAGAQLVDGAYVLDGVTYDATARRINVDVREIIEGTEHILRATVSLVETGTMTDRGFESNGTVDDKSLTFTNTYEADDATLNGAANLKVTKNLVGRDWNANDVFTFTLAAEADYGTKVIMPAETTVEITSADANYQEAFGDIVFTEIGTYNFIISENPVTQTSDGSIICDTDPVVVTVNVTDNGVGQLVAVATYSDNNSSLTFQNTYTPAPLSVSLEGTKVLTEPNGTKLEVTAGAFTFEVVRPEGSAAGVPNVNAINATAANAADGSVKFVDVVTFTEAGTYVYDIKEVAGSDANINYDGTTIKATIVVTYDHATGKLVAAAPTYSVADAEGFVFTNSYKSIPTTFDLDAVKTVDVQNGSYTMAEGDFEFVINSAGNPANDPVADGTVIKNNADGTINLFDNLVYSQEGTYTYTVSEVNRQYAGFTYDNAVYEVVVAVTYNKGQLVATPTITKVREGGNQVVTEAEFKFENTYDVYKTEVAIAGKKELNVSFTDTGFTFRFELLPISYTDEEGVTTTDQAEIPMPAQSIVTNTDGVFSFGQMTFTADMVGTYKYQVIEKNEGIPGMTYDGTAHDVTITVTKQDIDDNGTILKDAIVVTVDKTQDDIVFTNTYVPDEVTIQGSTAIQGTKKLTGRDMAAGEFTFTLTPVSYIDKDGYVTTAAQAAMPMPSDATTTNTGTGTESGFAFGAITFSEVGTYKYTITEVTGTKGGVVYDTQSFDVEVVVTDAGYDGQLDAEVKYYQGNASAAVVFENTYTAGPASINLDGMKKSLVGRGVAENEFEFVLTAKCYYEDLAAGPVAGVTVPMPANTTVTNGAYGDVTRINFGEIVFDKVGIYEYEISEVDNGKEFIVYDETKHTVRIQVTDDLDGQLKAEVITPAAEQSGLEGIVFSNQYQAPVITISKMQAINDGESTAQKTKVVAGDLVTYTLKVTNSGIGIGTAKDITITDEIPKGLVLVEDMISDGGTAKDGIVTWKIAELPAGESKEVSFQVKVPNVTKDTEWENIAIVTYGNNPENPDPDDPKEEPSNPVDIEVKVPKLAIVKTQQVNNGVSSEAAKTVNAGDKITYTIEVTNSGAGAATNVVLRDEIPEGLILVDGSITKDGVLKDGVITWNIGTLEPGSKVTVSFQVEVPAVKKAQEWKNVATVTYDNNPDGPDTPEESNEVTVTKTPETGDKTDAYVWAILALASLAMGTVTITVKRRRVR